MICLFMLLMYLLFPDKELLCFRTPLPLLPSDLLERENVIVERSAEKAGKTSRVF